MAKRLTDAQKRKKREIARKLKKTIQELEPMASGDRSAIAIRYDIEKDAAPLILAAGKGVVANEILRLAEENKIPLFEDRNLANLLIKLEVDTDIPPELYVLVAEVLAFVFKLEQMTSRRRKFERTAKRILGQEQQEQEE